MANHVVVQVEDRTWLIGEPSFLKSFFSTVAIRLETARWGERFPRVMSELYLGTLVAEHVAEAREELDVIVEELKAFPPSQIVWDADDLAARPPWGDDIADTITDLSNYFWTADGHDLAEVFREALQLADEQQVPVVIAAESQVAI